MVGGAVFDVERVAFMEAGSMAVMADMVREMWKVNDTLAWDGHALGGAVVRIARRERR